MYIRIQIVQMWDEIFSNLRHLPIKVYNVQLTTENDGPHPTFFAIISFVENAQMVYVKINWNCTFTNVYYLQVFTFKLNTRAWQCILNKVGKPLVANRRIILLKSSLDFC